RQEINEEGVTPTTEDATGISFEQRFAVPFGADVAYSYRIENKHIFEVEPDPLDPIPFDLRTRIGRLSGSFVMERRDDPFDATTGWFHSSTFEYAPEQLGSDLKFIKFL